MALLTALRTLLLDSLPGLAQSGAELYKEVDTVLKPNISFLKQVSLSIVKNV